MNTDGVRENFRKSSQFAEKLFVWERPHEGFYGPKKENDHPSFPFGVLFCEKDVAD